MAEEEKNTSTALRISLIAVTTAIVAVFTIALRIPTPIGGYVSLCDAAVTFVAYSFGPFTGFIASGLGTAIADLIGGYGQWAPISFITHGLEALAIALIVRKNPASFIYKIISAIIAAIIVAGGYFLLTGAFLIGFSASLAEVPANLVQAIVGVIIGLPLSLAVRRAYRKIDDIAW